ncbi:MAG: bifunctional riboflavin kinase/FAD synthetase [Gemmatimonadales bacterium]
MIADDLATPASGSVVTVGSFDGMHRGHRAVIEEAVSRAARAGRVSVVVTFEPHPAAVLAEGGGPPRLTTAEERLEVLAECGVDRVLVLRFDRGLAALEPERFVREILIDRCGMRELVIGPDHGFGRDRSGDRRTLPALGDRLGFGVTMVGPVPDAQGANISSTRIREALGRGDLARAARWLGRPYRVSGRVVPGAGRGRGIGIPTLNLEGPPPEKALPPDGVYAVRVEWGGGTAGGMLNQGPRPTVGDHRRSLEAHLFGFDGDLYGRTVRIEWVARLREIRRFESLEALRHQLGQDREASLAALAGGTQTSTARPAGAR